jgi:hypothetical protein
MASVEVINKTEEWAQELASRGLAIFPLRPRSKKPYGGEKWGEIMTTEAETIHGWFEHRPGMNYGVCGRKDHVIVDLDIKDGKEGVKNFNDLHADQEIEDWVVGETFTVSTPSGGVHLYLKTDKTAGNSHRFPEGIDIRGQMGYVVGPGCYVKDDKVDGPYEVTSDTHLKDAPTWVKELLKEGREKVRVYKEPAFDLDSPESIQRGIEMLKLRDPAIEGMGGDEHTYHTALQLIDLGLSQEVCIEVMNQPYMKAGDETPMSWNERCEPPWDSWGAVDTLEAKVNNAWKYREQQVGSKGGGSAEDAFDGQEEGTQDFGEYTGENRFKRLADHRFRGESSTQEGREREYVVAEWMLAHGMTAVLAKRGGGKTVVMMDLALRIAHDMDWMDVQVMRDFHVIYICGEDEDGAREQIRAWKIANNVSEISDRFIFMDIITDLKSPEDTREWAEFMRQEVGQHGRAAVFLDTWQRATSRGGQNKDEDMQNAVHHAEALARSLNGPAVVAFHPPKHDSTIVLGSSIIENSTTGIWSITDHTSGIKLEVTRMKGRGTGNDKIIRFDSIGLGMEDQFGKERTGLVPVAIGGSSEDRGPDEGHEVARTAFATVLREIELRRKQDNPESTKNYTVSTVAKMLSAKISDDAKEGDEWSMGLIKTLRDSGVVNLSSWQIISRSIRELMVKDPRPFEFEDGTSLRLYKDSNAHRISLIASGFSD